LLPEEEIESTLILIKINIRALASPGDAFHSWRSVAAERFWSQILIYSRAGSTEKVVKLGLD